MPQMLEIFGYKIFFWSNEGRPLEPVHVHISKHPHSNATKAWILSDGKVVLANNNDCIPDKLLNKILKTVEDYSDLIIREWVKSFNAVSYKDSLPDKFINPEKDSSHRKRR